MPDVNLINTNLHNVIVRRDLSDAERLDKVTRLLKMGADPFITITSDEKETGEKKFIVPAFLTALKRDHELVVQAILKYGNPKDLSSIFPYIEDGLPKEFDAYRANWCHIAALNTSPDCLQLVKDHQNTHFPHHRFKSAINKKFYYCFPNNKWKLTTIGSVLLSRISMLDASYSSSTYGDSEAFVEFLTDWLFCSAKEAPSKAISPQTTIAMQGALATLTFLLKSGLNSALTDHNGLTLQHLSERLFTAFSNPEEFIKIEDELIWDNIRRTSKVLMVDGAVIFAARMKNAYELHETKCQISLQYKEIAHCVKHTVEETSSVVQHLEGEVAEVKVRVHRVEGDVAEVKRTVAKLEATIAEGKDEQFKKARNTFTAGSQYRIGFQALHTRIHGLLQQTLESTAGVYATEMSEDTKMGLNVVSLFSIGGIGGQIVNPAAGIISVIQAVSKIGLLCREVWREKKTVNGLESATYNAEAEAHILATSIACGLMHMAEKVYGSNITESEQKALVSKLFSRIQSQVKTLAGKQFKSPDALAHHLAKTAAAHLQAEYAKLQAGATVVEFARPKAGSGGSNNSNGSGKSNTSGSTPVKASQHSSDSERELFPRLANGSDGTPPKVTMHAHRAPVAKNQAPKPHTTQVKAPPTPPKRKSSTCVIS